MIKSTEELIRNLSCPSVSAFCSITQNARALDYFRFLVCLLLILNLWRIRAPTLFPNLSDRNNNMLFFNFLPVQSLRSSPCDRWVFGLMNLLLWMRKRTLRLGCFSIEDVLAVRLVSRSSPPQSTVQRAALEVSWNVGFGWHSAEGNDEVAVNGVHHWHQCSSVFGAAVVLISLLCESYFVVLGTAPGWLILHLIILTFWKSRGFPTPLISALLGVSYGWLHFPPVSYKLKASFIEMIRFYFIQLYTSLRSIFWLYSHNDMLVNYICVSFPISFHQASFPGFYSEDVNNFVHPTLLPIRFSPQPHY